MKKMKRILSLVLAVCICLSGIPLGKVRAADSRVEAAIQWAYKIANDNSYGYSQDAKKRWGTPSYDCSSYIISAFSYAGFNINRTGYTGTMKSAFTAAGFDWIPMSKISGKKDLIRGDILLNEVHHTELYVGNGRMLAAHKDYDGKDGDSSGNEICEGDYYSYSKSWDGGWDGVLRYAGATKPDPVNATTITATYAPNSVTLNWTAVSGATSYEIQRCPSGETTYTTAGTSNTASFTDSGLIAGKKYYYRIYSVNSAGKSKRSDKYTAIMIPSSVAASAVTTKVMASAIKFTWSKVTGATGYEIYRRKSGDADYAKIADVTKRTYYDKTIEAGHKYYYRFYAKNASGLSQNPETISATALSQGVPASSVTKTVTETTVKLVWEKPVGADSYEVYRRLPSEKEYQLVSKQSNRTYIERDLEPGQKYYYRIYSVNESGKSKKAETIAIVTIPNAVDASTITAKAGTGTVTLRWTKVKGATKYEIVRRLSGAENYETVGTVEKTNKFTDTGLQSGKTYYYRIYAVNDFGKSVKSGTVSAKTK